MVIRKMNTMFDRHGRYILSALTLIIIVTFVGFFTPGFSRLLSGEVGKHNPVLGESFGKKIRKSDYDTASNDIAIAKALDPRVPKTVSIQRLAPNTQAAMMRICMLRAADQRGILVSDKEVTEAIQTASIFQTNKQFDSQKLQEFIARLEKDNLTPDDLKSAIKSNLQYNKLIRSVLDNVLITKNERKTHLIASFEKFDVRVFDFNANQYLKKIHVTDEELKNYFNSLTEGFKQDQEAVKVAKESVKKAQEKNDYDAINAAYKNLDRAEMNLNSMKKAPFIIPEQYTVILAAFPYEQFKALAQKNIKPSDIADYYNKNKSKFAKAPRYKSFKSVKKEITEKLTKINKALKKKTTAADIQKYYNENRDAYQLPIEFKTLKEATEDITKALVKIKSKQLAIRKASIFTRNNYRQLAVAPGDKKTLFVNNTKKEKEATLIDNIPPFGINTPIIKGVGKELELIKAVAAIDPKTTSVSNAAVGKNAVYVALLINKQPLRLATLSEVKREIKARYKREKALKLARETGRNILTKLLKEKNIKKTLETLEKEKKIKANKLNSFPAKYAEIFNYAPFRVAVATKEGELSPFTTTPSGGFFLIVDKRTVPTDKELEMSAKTFRDNYDVQKSNAQLNHFISWVIIKNSKSKFLQKQ